MRSLQQKQKNFTCAFEKRLLSRKEPKVAIINLDYPDNQLFVGLNTFFKWLSALNLKRPVPGLKPHLGARNTQWTLTIQHVGDYLFPMWKEFMLPLIKKLK